MKKRQAAIDEAYEAQWDGGKGSHHPDYNPYAQGENVKRASRETEELLNAIIKVMSLIYTNSGKLSLSLPALHCRQLLSVSSVSIELAAKHRITSD